MKLGKNAKGIWDGEGGITLWKNHESMHLEASELKGLIAAFLEEGGTCSICFKDIPMGHGLCQECAESEAAKWTG